MTQKTFESFINEFYSQAPKKSDVTNKANVIHNDDTWSLDMLDLKDYGPENNRSFRYVLVVIDDFSKLDWTVPLRKKIKQ